MPLFVVPEFHFRDLILSITPNSEIYRFTAIAKFRSTHHKTVKARQQHARAITGYKMLHKSQLSAVVDSH
jgi:hypothetical protein